MRAYELTEARNTGFQLYCDMDGVLVDFRKGAAEFMADASYGEEYVVQGYDVGHGKISAPFWKKLALVNKIAPDEVNQVWANLDWMPDGKKLWSYISKYDPFILSSPGTSSRDIIVTGKEIWLEKNLGLSHDRYIFDKDKWKYATGKAGIQAILIDDMKNKIDPWIENGGIGILHTNAASTINQLKEWGL